jgi:glycosyltransferase involved in cell wall biosynthesis
MKIVFVHPAYMDYRQKLFEQLNEKYDVTFVFTKQGRGQNNVKEVHLEIPSHWKYKILKSNFLVAGKDIFMNLKLMNEIIFGKYDIVMTSTSRYTCYMAARLKKSKFIFLTEFWHFSSEKLIRTLLNLFTKTIARNSDAIISMGSRTSLELLTWGVEPDKIYMHPQCSLDYTEIVVPDLNEIRMKHGIGNKKVIFFLGRFIELKGVEYLIKSFALLEKKYDNCFLIIGGTGSLEHEYLKTIEELQVKNVLITQAFTPEEKSTFYRICNLFVLPSIFLGDNGYEPWGLVINEAMAFGKPIISTDAVGSSYDLVKSGINGFIVKNKDIEELEYAMYRILTNEELETTMGMMSRNIFEEKNNCLNFFKVFEKAIENV